MKNVTKTIVALVVGLFTSASVLAIPAGFGDVDTFLISTSISNSGKGTEETWFENWLLTEKGIDVDLNFNKTNTEDGAGWTLTDGFLTYDFGTAAPQFFMIKIGGGNLPDGLGTHYFFQNNNDFTKALVSMADMFGDVDFDFDFSVTRLSHLGKFGDVEVNEPASLTLLALGLIGLGMIRLRSGNNTSRS